MDVHFIITVHTLKGKLPNACKVWFDTRWSAFSCAGENGMFAVHGVSRPLAGADSINDSVKVHLFMASACGDETRSDFMYASAFPLAALTKPGFSKYGVFNYNTTDGSSTAPVRDTVLLVFNMLPVTIPVRLLPTAGPDENFHHMVRSVADGIATSIRSMCPKANTAFINNRTYCRDRCLTVLFQDLSLLYDMPSTSLPPLLACYALCNALIVNRITLPDFVSLIRRPDDLLLRVVRDMLAPWTMCAKEGIYWADTSLGSPVEDQPFQNTFSTGTRVFQKDDCEGRAAQIMLMIILLKSISDSTPLPRGRCLRMGKARLKELMQACASLGAAFTDGTLEAHMVVGDACFASFDHQHADSVVGHSFAMLFYNKDGRKGGLVMETTGWEKRELPSDVKPSARVKAMACQIRGVVKNVCQVMTAKQEDNMYRRIYLGNGCMFFTMSDGVLEYGSTPQLLCKTLQKCTSLQGLPRTGAFAISTLDFLAHKEVYAKVLEQIPDIKRTCMPPQQDTAYILKLMDTWGTIAEKHLPTQSGPLPPLIFSMLSHLQPPFVVRSHPFIHSNVYYADN